MKKIGVLLILTWGIFTFSTYANNIHTAKSNPPAEVVNMNTASAAELATLKGVGVKKAQAIVDYRTTHGPFKNLNDLASVKGIGTKMLARLEAKNPGKITIAAQ